MTIPGRNCSGVQGFKYKVGRLEGELIIANSGNDQIASDDDKVESAQLLRLSLFWTGKNGLACHANENSLQFDGYAERGLELGEILIQVGESLKELAQEWPRRDVQPAETISW